MLRGVFLSTVFILFVSTQSQARLVNQFGDFLDNIIPDLVIDNSASFEVPIDKLKNIGDKDLWVKSKIGYKIQFMNYPGDPTRYLRREALQLSLSVPINIPNLPVSIGPQIPKVEAEFIRPFFKKDLSETVKGFFSDEKLYTPNHAPHTAFRALQLKTGDYYSFTTTLGLGIGASTAHTQGLAFLGSNANYIVSGDFKIDVYRLTETKVKVVISSQKQRRFTIGSQFSLVPDLEVFGFNPIDKIINQQLKVDVMNWNTYDTSKGSLFSVSYTYDLNSPDARVAYDALLNPKKWKWPDLNISNLDLKQFNSNQRNFWMGDLQPSEFNSSITNSGVFYNDESKIEFVKVANGINFDLKIANLNRQSNFLEIDYNLRKNAQDPFEKYRIASLLMNFSYNFGIGLLPESEIAREATVIFELDDMGKMTEFKEIFFSFQRTDDHLYSGGQFLKRNEVASIYGQFRKMLPDGLHYRINDLQKVIGSANGQSAHTSMEMNFSPEALKAVASLTPAEVINTVDDFIDLVVLRLESKNSEDRDYYGKLELHQAIDQHLNTPNGTVRSFFSRKKMDLIKNSLVYVFTQHTQYDDFDTRWEVFKNLRHSVVFRDFGSAILSRLLQRSVLKNNLNIFDLISFRLYFTKQGAAPQMLRVGMFIRPLFTQDLIRDRDRVLNRRYNPEYFIE